MQPQPLPTAATGATATPAARAKARFWDRVARKYAADPIADLAGYETTLRRVKALLSPEHKVLEIGCGTGSTALRLAGGTRQMLATDVSAEMITIAREKLTRQTCPQLRFELADAESLPATNEPHDVVLALNVVHLFANLEHALDAVLAALKPGGRFISKTPCLAEMNPIISRLLVPIMRALGRAPAVLVFDAHQLQAALQRRGLCIEAVERHGTQRKDMRVSIVARKPL